MSNKNGYNRDSPMDFIMGKPVPLANIEQDQKSDDALLRRLAKILEDLPNLED